MSGLSHYFEPLAEQERMAYLDAMDIPLWILRDDSAEAVAVAEVETETEYAAESQQAESQSHSESNESDHLTELNIKALDSKPLDSDPLDTLVRENNTAQVISDNIRQNTSEIKPQSSLKTNQCFLKMVNWQSKDAADKSLLIVCRHQIDQPAHSFAKPNAPSQFMNDYIQAFESLIIPQSLSVQIQLAHLTEAGLGNDNFPIEKTLTELKPDLILLLGDDSVKLLFNLEQDVAQMRGKVQYLDINTPLAEENKEPQLNSTVQNSDLKTRVLVSYHPFSLIENPALKKLAFEDLSLLVKIINSRD